MPQPTRAERTMMNRYHDYRNRRVLEAERAYSDGLPGWRTQGRRRLLVRLLLATFAFMAVVSVSCASGIQWAPLLWLPACLVLLPLWRIVHMVSGRRSTVPDAALDEYELAQRNSARSLGLSVTQLLVLIPALYLIFGSVITHGADTDMAYAGGLMVLTAMLAGGCTPAMVLAWTRVDPVDEDA